MNKCKKICGRLSCVITILSSVIAIGTIIAMLYFIGMTNLGNIKYCFMLNADAFNFKSQQVFRKLRID